MVYQAIGLMSGSSLDGLDIVCAEFQEQGGKWSFLIKAADCYPYPAFWKDKLVQATRLTAKDYLLLHTEYGHYTGKEVLRFIEKNNLEFKVALVSSHGHTSFHLPGQGMTAQLGDGASIASELDLPVITDLRSIDVALGGQGAPIVPIGEKLLFGEYDYYLNIGGIANISFHTEPYVAFDICPANRVLNLLAADAGKEFDEDGQMAGSGKIDPDLLEKLNSQSYYGYPYPKSLANDFGTDTMYPLTRKAAGIGDALRTYVEHIAIQVKNALEIIPGDRKGGRMLVTGGGALNKFLISRVETQLKDSNIQIIVPSAEIINYKEALVMAFIGVLRWRQEANVLSSVTGASRDSIGGAIWIS